MSEGGAVSLAYRSSWLHMFGVQHKPSHRVHGSIPDARVSKSAHQTSSDVLNGLLDVHA